MSVSADPGLKSCGWGMQRRRHAKRPMRRNRRKTEHYRMVTPPHRGKQSTSGIALQAMRNPSRIENPEFRLSPTVRFMKARNTCPNPTLASSLFKPNFGPGGDIRNSPYAATLWLSQTPLRGHQKFKISETEVSFSLCFFV